MELANLLEHFNTQEKCIEHLEKVKWSSIPTCPYCGSQKASKRKNEFRHKCHDCNRSYSVLVGTIMESTKLPLFKWFAAMILITNAKKGISSLQLSRDLGVNKNTAWYLQKRIRQAMDDDDTILSGIIEADETYVGGSLYNKHFLKKKAMNYNKTGMEHKSPVLGMLQRKGKISVKVLEKAWGKEMKPILMKKISKESELVTDGFGGYAKLEDHFKKHIILNHNQSIRKIGDYHTNTIEGFWSMLKRAIIGQYHKVTPLHLQDYVNEIAFKYNNRNNPYIFDTLLLRTLRVEMPLDRK